MAQALILSGDIVGHMTRNELPVKPLIAVIIAVILIPPVGAILNWLGTIPQVASNPELLPEFVLVGVMIVFVGVVMGMIADVLRSAA